MVCVFFLILLSFVSFFFFFFFQAEDGIRDTSVTGVQTCALPICSAVERFGVQAGVMLLLNDTVQEVEAFWRTVPGVQVQERARRGDGMVVGLSAQLHFALVPGSRSLSFRHWPALAPVSWLTSFIWLPQVAQGGMVTKPDMVGSRAG